MENTQIIDKLVQSYNRRDARSFADLFAADVVAYTYPNEPSQNGREEIFKFYTERFAEFPENQTEVLHRILIGNRVIDHERVRRSQKDEPFEVIAIYEVENGLIKRFEIIGS